MTQPASPCVTTGTPAERSPSRLMAGWADTGRPADFAAHDARYGPIPLPAYAGSRGRERLIDAVDTAGLRGRGGGGFPTGRKLRAVGGRAVVVVNGCDGEPVSDKDRTLLTLAPHLVLDGAELAAHAVNADRVILCLHRDDPATTGVVAALAQRPVNGPKPRLVEVPRRYVSSEESALVNYLNTGDGRPTLKPPLPFEQGVNGRPTFVGNVETLAHLALIARYGPDWFRACGTRQSPGTALITVSGAVARPGVHEVALGTPIGEALRLAGGLAEPVQAVLVGGLGGAWLPLSQAVTLPLAHDDLVGTGASLGAGALVALPATVCGLTETARIVRYLAGESAAQCGPCMFGLPAISEDLEHLARGAGGGEQVRHRLRRRLKVITGRGACAHPDGAVRLAASALRAFHADVAAHLAGRPCREATHGWLPLPSSRPMDWQ